uniref:AsmA family protein n=1 Tax=Rhizobium sp. TaxID=391 RepID=UPI002898D5AB
MFGRVIVAIGGFIVVVLFAALLAPFVLDWSSFRVEFEQQASRMLGKKVSVHGEVDARILPFPSITLHDVRVGQDVDGKPLAQIASFSMDMELAPFLSGGARIFDMRIEDPTVRVRVLKD